MRLSITGERDVNCRLSYIDSISEWMDETARLLIREDIEDLITVSERAPI
ncbi:MAG: hypothetical protein ACI88A_000127 [Paraglaciecola sp.]|jgi:hypothetical protein